MIMKEKVGSTFLVYLFSTFFTFISFLVFLMALFLTKSTPKKYSQMLSHCFSQRYATQAVANAINLDGKYYTHSLDNPGPPLLLSHNIRSLPMSPSVRINEIQQELVQQGRKVYRMGFGQSPFPVQTNLIFFLFYFY